MKLSVGLFSLFISLISLISSFSAQLNARIILAADLGYADIGKTNHPTTKTHGKSQEENVMTDFANSLGSSQYHQ